MFRYYISKTSWLGGRYGVLFLVLVVCLLFAGIWTYQFLQGKERAIARAKSNTANLVHIIEEANNRTLQAIDLTLNNIAMSVQQGRWNEGYDANKYLQSLLDESPQVREVAFADKTGRVTVSSRGKVHDSLSIKDETFFTQALEGTLPSLFISSPRSGRFLNDISPTGQWHLIMAKTVYDDNGDLAGLALAVINPCFFQELISTLNIGEKGYVAYYRYDGILLMTSDSASLDQQDANPASNLIFSQYLPKKEWGTFTFTKRVDNPSTYIVSYRATSRWPLLVVVGLEQDEVLTPWIQEVRDFSILIVVSILILLGLAVIVFNQHLANERLALKLIEAHHDALTGIPSLRLCLNRLSHALIRAKRERDLLAVFFIDLDGFKSINDNYGHDAGDYVLQEIARRLSSCVRQMDTVGRLGGDEFLIILPKINDISSVERVGASIITSIKEPIHWKNEEVSVSASIGIAIHPRDGDDAEQLIKKADQAMYKAKRNGKKQYTLAK